MSEAISGDEIPHVAFAHAGYLLPGQMNIHADEHSF